jgi:hypothetical protein
MTVRRDPDEYNGLYRLGASVKCMLRPKITAGAITLPSSEKLTVIATNSFLFAPKASDN